MRERVRRLLFNCISPLRRHDWEVDQEWIRLHGGASFKRTGQVLTRQVCKRCGVKTEPFGIGDRQTFSRYHNATGCRGYKR